MNEEQEKDLELRMYFFVPYQLTGIQQGIQAGHAALEYAMSYGNTKLFRDFATLHKTWIVLNGGTTNSRLIADAKPRDDDDVYIGSLDNIYHQLISNGIICSSFQEPDLNDTLTAICFICDEHVWDYEKYPDWKDYILERSLHPLDDRKKSYDDLKHDNPTFYYNWSEEVMGGSKNVFLRNLLKGKKFA